MKTTQIQISCGERKDFNIEIRKQFNIEAGITAFLYQRNITKKIKGLQKITIDLIKEKNITSIGNYKELEGVTWIFKSFDLKKYFGKTDKEQKIMILEILHNIILQMCEKFKIDKIPFVNAYEKVIENNYKNQYIFNRLTFSRNRKYKAGIEINMTKNGTKINILFTDKNENILKRNEIFKTFSHYYFVHQIIYSGKWLDNQKYIASSRNKNVNFIASINSLKTELKIKPKEKEKEILEKLNRMKI